MAGSRALAWITLLAIPVLDPRVPALSAPTALVVVKTAHTLAWAVFAGCILAIPLVSWRDQHRAAGWPQSSRGEVAVLVFNRWRCPLTSVAARYTDDRRPNFDIYLPEWLAQHNKLIFGALYCAGVVFAIARWARAPS